jgi:hypothetical protein
MRTACGSSVRSSGPAGSSDKQIFLPVMLIVINKSCDNAMEREEIMQQRFCHCGYRVWVEYVLTEVRCRILFWPNLQRRGQRLKLCPVCGSHLSIDELH